MTELEKEILAIVSQIPTGKITTYQLIAKKLGNKKLARVVGNALNKNPGEKTKTTYKENLKFAS